MIGEILSKFYESILTQEYRFEEIARKTESHPHYPLWVQRDPKRIETHAWEVLVRSAAEEASRNHPFLIRQFQPRQNNEHAFLEHDGNGSVFLYRDLGTTSQQLRELDHLMEINFHGGWKPLIIEAKIRCRDIHQLRKQQDEVQRIYRNLTYAVTIRPAHGKEPPTVRRIKPGTLFWEIIAPGQGISQTIDHLFRY